MIVRAARGSDRDVVVGLLEEAGLPTVGIPLSMDAFLVAESGGAVSGAIGLEIYGDRALLRSAVVAPGDRGTGIGRELVNGVVAVAGSRGVRELFLLTTTAEPYFHRYGFERVDRSEVPAALLESVEFAEACPASAAVMQKRLADTR